MTSVSKSPFGIAALLLVGGSLAGCGGDGSTAAPCKAGSGVICSIAGTGVAGDGADGQKPLDTRLYYPIDVSIGPAGEPFVLDWNNHRIRKIGKDGLMKIVAGAGQLGTSSDDPETNRLNHPTDLVCDSMGRMVIAAWHNSKIKRVDLATGEMTDACGTGKRAFSGDGGPAIKADLDLPVGVAFDKDGNLYIADQANKRIRMVDTMDMISTWAGTPPCMTPPCPIGDGGPKEMAFFNLPGGQAAKPGGKIAFDSAGNLYIADTANHRVRKIATDGIVTTVAGNGTIGASGDGGPATDAQLNRPADVAVGPDNLIYVADTGNNCVRRIGADGNIAAVAGVCCGGSTCDTVFSGDGGPATAAKLNQPYGITLDSAGNLYVADTQNNRVRVVY